VVIFIGIVIKEINLVYCGNNKINYILKGLGRIIYFIASNIVNLIVVIVKKVRDNIAMIVIDLKTFLSRYLYLYIL